MMAPWRKSGPAEALNSPPSTPRSKTTSISITASLACAEVGTVRARLVFVRSK
jgi:hypothetical protein